MVGMETGYTRTWSSTKHSSILIAVKGKFTRLQRIKTTSTKRFSCWLASAKKKTMQNSRLTKKIFNIIEQLNLGFPQSFIESAKNNTASMEAGQQETRRTYLDKDGAEDTRSIVRKREEPEAQEAGRGRIDAEKQRPVEHAILAAPRLLPPSPLFLRTLDTVVYHPLVFRFSFFLSFFPKAGRLYPLPLPPLGGLLHDPGPAHGPSIRLRSPHCLGWWMNWFTRDRHH